MHTINYLAELEQVSEYWSPRVVAQVNNQYVKVAKLMGEFTWHKHDDEDELFHIIKGELVMHYEGQQVLLKQGDVHVVPKGVLHNPYAEQECWVALIETVTTKHTGDTLSAQTKSIDEQLGSFN